MPNPSRNKSIATAINNYNIKSDSVVSHTNGTLGFQANRLGYLKTSESYLQTPFAGIPVIALASRSLE
jgi:hypothetical protein